MWWLNMKLCSYLLWMSLHLGVKELFSCEIYGIQMALLCMNYGHITV